MNRASPDQPAIRECLCRFFDQVPSVEFVYLFSPLQGTGEESLTDYDIAIAFEPFLSLTQMFTFHIDLFNDLREELKTDRIALVVINECPFEYQRLIYRTGTPVFQRNSRACEAFQDQFKPRRRFLPV